MEREKCRGERRCRIAVVFADREMVLEEARKRGLSDEAMVVERFIGTSIVLFIGGM